GTAGGGSPRCGRPDRLLPNPWGGRRGDTTTSWGRPLDRPGAVAYLPYPRELHTDLGTRRGASGPACAARRTAGEGRTGGVAAGRDAVETGGRRTMEGTVKVEGGAVAGRPAGVNGKGAPQGASGKPGEPAATGISFQRYFTRPGIDPFDAV